MGVSSEQSGDNMNRFVVALAFVGCAFGAPSILPAVGHAYTAGSAVVGHGPAVATSGAYAAGPAVAHGAPVASAPAVVGQTHHTYAAGAPAVENRVEYGVVGHQVVQTGEVSVVGGHQYAVAGVESIPQPAVSSIAGPPVNTVETRPLPPPVIPHAAPTLLPSPLLPPTRDPLLLTPWSSRRSSLPRGPTPGSLPSRPTSSPSSMYRTTTLTSPSMSPFPSSVRSS